MNSYSRLQQILAVNVLRVKVYVNPRDKDLNGPSSVNLRLYY